MNKAKRQAIIAGNWKMNKTPAETTALINEMKPLVADADCEVVLCVPFIDREVYDNSIETIRDALDQARIKKEEKLKAIKRLDDFIKV